MNTQQLIMARLGLIVAAVIIASLALVFMMLKKSIASTRRTIFYWVLISILIASIGAILADLPAVLRAGDRWIFVQDVGDILYHCFHTSLAALYVLYILEVTGALFGRSKRYFAIFWSPLILAILVTITNPLHRQLYYFSANNQYTRGPLIGLIYLVGGMYIVLCVYLFIHYRDAATKLDLKVIAFLMGISILGMAIQAFWPNFLVELFAETLTAVGILLTAENEDTEIDSETFTNNQEAFRRRCLRMLRSGKPFGILVVDLRNMPMYDRVLQAEHANELRRDVADYLVSCTKRSNVFRYDRTHFALCLFSEYREEVLSDLAQKIAGRFEGHWQTQDVYAMLEATVVAIRVPEDVNDYDAIKDMVDAEYGDGTHRIPVVAGSDLAAGRRVPLVEKAIRRGLQEGNFEVYYQPIWSAETKTIVAAEALMRLKDPELGMIPPIEFIKAAEHNGMIVDIGNLVFEEVGCFIHDQDITRFGLEYIEVNLSLYQFIMKGLVDHLDQIRQRYDVDVHQLNMEITETGAHDDTMMLLASALKRMRSMGYRFSLDDYGTGYSNLDRLITGEYMNVKIDKSILWDGDQNDSSKFILDTLLGIVRGLGLNVIQEGVETKEQLERVTEGGANLIQGYYFSKPLPEAEFLQYVREFNHCEN